MIKTMIKPRSAEFERNQRHMQAQVSDLREVIAAISQGGGKKRHLERGKLLVRDRIDQLLDPGSPFLELSQLAAYHVYDDSVPAA